MVEDVGDCIDFSFGMFGFSFCSTRKAFNGTLAKRMSATGAEIVPSVQKMIVTDLQKLRQTMCFVVVFAKHVDMRHLFRNMDQPFTISFSLSPSYSFASLMHFL